MGTGRRRGRLDRSGAMGRAVRRVSAAAAVVLLTAAAGSAQGTCQAPADAIRIVGAVDAPVTITRADMEAMEPLTVRAVGHDQTERTYQGSTLRSLLDRAGVPGGSDLHGRALSGYVVVEARDGYRVTFALAELDAGYWDALPTLAYRRDGAPLDAEVGPFQVITPDSPQHGRWVRQVACLRVAYPEP